MLTGEPITPAGKALLDLSAVATAFGAFMNWLPAIASLFSCIWIGLNIIDWFQKRREKRKREEALKRVESV